MLYANSNAGSKILATIGAEGYCPGCNTKLSPKCGSTNVHHCAHVASVDCDPWHEGETPWHRNKSDRNIEKAAEIIGLKVCEARDGLANLNELIEKADKHLKQAIVQ